MMQGRALRPDRRRAELAPRRATGDAARFSRAVRASGGLALGAIGTLTLSGGPAAAMDLLALGGAAGGLPTAHLFAAGSGAVAVAAILTALALWRRVRATARRAQGLRSRLEADLSQERVFVIVEGRLQPASPATEAFVKARFQQMGEAAGGASAARAGALFDEETARALGGALRKLATEGAPFEANGRDYAGRPMRVIGRSVGAKAVIRLWPAEPGAVGAAPERTPDHEGDVAPPAPDAEALRLAFDMAPAGAAVFDAQGRLATANAAFAKLLRLEPSWLTERPTFRSVLNAARTQGRVPERAGFADWLAMVAADPVAALGPETLWTLGDGDALQVSPHAAPSGGFMLLVTDQTDALSLERRYKSAVGGRLAALNAIDQGLALIGVDGRALAINPAFGRIWGLDLTPPSGDLRRGSPALEGAPLGALAELAGRDARDAEVWARIRAAVEARGAQRQAEQFHHARGTGRILSIQISPQPDGGALVACADVTDARRAEQALADKAAALEAADRLKSDFLNSVAGQLRTPVDTVITFAEALRDGSAGPLRKRQREHLEDVLRAANNLREVVSDALALGALRGEAATEIQEAPLDLRRTLASLATSMAARARRRGAELTAALPSEPVATLGDEPRLKQAITGAIAAALAEASAGDRMALRLSRRDGAQGPEAAIEIQLRRKAATGAIASVAATTASPFASDAAAVAVSLARRIVEAHGGWLELWDEEGDARASFRLPLKAPAARGARRTEPAPEAEPRRAAGQGG